MPSYEDYLPTLRFQSTLALSPDGNLVAYVDDAVGQLNASVLDMSGGDARRLTSYTDSTVKRVCWHPGGKSLIFLADTRGDENAQIYQVGLDGGDPRPLTEAPDVQHVVALGDPFSPDGQLLAYASNDRTPGDQDVLVRDLRTGAVRRVYAEGGRVFAGHWSPDGTRLTVAEWREGNSDHVVYLVPAAGGPTTCLTPKDVAATYWLGPWLADGSGFLVMSDAGRDFTGLAVMDALSGQLSWLDTPDWDVEEVALAQDGRTLIWTVNVEGASQLLARDLATGVDLDVPALPMGQVSSLTITNDGRLAVMLLSTPSRPQNVVAIDLTSGRLRWLTDATPTAADPRNFIEPTLVRYPARDGREIPAYLYRPLTTAPTGVVLAIHGGPPAQERPNYTQDGFFQYLASHGVAVFAPNVRGSTGYGMSYQKLSYRDWGGGDLADFADAAHYLRRQSWVDPARIGLIGRSYGGFAVLSCVARLPDLDWAAAVAWCGPSNLLTFTQAQPPTWRSKVAAMIGDPDTDAEFLLSRSPVMFADQIRAPLLVIQGANDARVPQHESERIVKRLRERGVEIRYDVYPDEGHVFGKRVNQVKARSDAGDFLLTYLQGEAAR